MRANEFIVEADDTLGIASPGDSFAFLKQIAFAQV